LQRKFSKLKVPANWFQIWAHSKSLWSCSVQIRCVFCCCWTIQSGIMIKGMQMFDHLTLTVFWANLKGYGLHF
jgi:hypothetical protein